MPAGASAIGLDHDESMDQGCISPNDVFSTFDVPISESAPWGAPISSTAPGVYIVGLHPDPADGRGLPIPPIDAAALCEWVRRVPLLRVAGQQMSPDALGRHIANWWLPSTSVLYIGKAGVLKKRLSEYLRTPIGAPGPHRGGQWLKVLSILPRLTVHYAELPPQWSKPEDLEDDLLNAFVNRHGPVPADHPEPLLPLPWANLRIDRPKPRRQRRHGIHPNTL